MGDNINIYNVAMDGRLINVVVSIQSFHHCYHPGYPAFIFFFGLIILTFLCTAVATSHPLSLIF
jgi:hypothetical protein